MLNRSWSKWERKIEEVIYKTICVRNKKAKYVIKISIQNDLLKYYFKCLDDICNTSSLGFTRTIKKKKRKEGLVSQYEP